MLHKKHDQESHKAKGHGDDTVDQDQDKLNRDEAEQRNLANAKPRQEDRRSDVEKQTEKEKNGPPSVKIYRMAADLLEAASKRPRDVIDAEVQIATSNEVQAALIRSIIAHMDGNIPEPVVPNDRTYSENWKKEHPARNDHHVDNPVENLKELREPALA